MTIEKIKEDINGFLVDELEIDQNKITDDARLKEDVGIDSLDYVDIVAFISRNFGFKIDKTEMKDVLTLGQFYEYIKGKTE
jgi:acyl carrier protein